jgi:diacylglycerol kinase (ATP)
VSTARLIANPAAGSDAAAEKLATMRERLRGVYELDAVLTRGPGDARRAARESAVRGDTHLFVAGGDGTLNEAINGLAGVAGALSRTAVGVIPLGTGNDFAAALGIPAPLDDALDVMLRGRTQAIDVGEVNGRVFVNVSAGGFLADVSDAVDVGLKSVAGRLAYLLGGAKVLLQAEPFHVGLTGAGAPTAADCLFFAVCNAPMIGGGRLIAPDARLDDGRLDVCLVEAMDLLAFVALLRRVSDGSHVEDERVRYFRAAQCSLAFDRRVAVNADGEVFQADRCDYRVRPAAARVIV